MALATRCPSCQAVFRVVSDQLKLRGGLVRCGNCRHVFDAIGSLSYVEEAAVSVIPPATDAPAAADLAAARAPATQEASAPATRSMKSAAAPATRAVEPQRIEPDAVHATAPPQPSPAGAQPPVAEVIDAAPSPPEAHDDTSASAPDPLAVPTLLAPRSADDEAAAERDARAPTEPAGDTTSDAAAVAEEPTEQIAERRKRKSRRREPPPTDDAAQVDDTAEVAFLKDTRPSRGFSIVYGGGSLLLAVLLLLQGAVAFRSELLVRWPELRPRLADMCELYGCTVGWPTRAEMLAVVGTELQAVPGTDILELTAVIRNRAAYRVALPAVEVALTDTTNRTLARKVFAPVDYLASSGEPSSRINEGLGPGSDYVVRITFEARGLNAAGFVVYPFYL
ncbi:MAG: zinc-ribbon domain-containing protein [Burkholderiaceae bacterium]|jgi:predicted Zn finger-like uncharacterized protein|nr:zinc-ribbon domain-containing protein [Burkholderiaceae bacterium]